ncbi:hypothetical protein B0H15DRAFT_958845 [Mycena belliarum]|uniref:Uncharacterized protein n=1 Tax=Mycena belliarum TaxID=1033014 RepID=A0AAD6XH72_9AGAR|nr:hypothetical protein B0H15DRAFT_958845 [Mycena belliae]
MRAVNRKKSVALILQSEPYFCDIWDFYSVAELEGHARAFKRLLSAELHPQDSPQTTRAAAERRARTTSRAVADGSACAAFDGSQAGALSPIERAETIGQGAGAERGTSCIRNEGRFAKELPAKLNESARAAVRRGSGVERESPTLVLPRPQLSEPLETIRRTCTARRNGAGSAGVPGATAHAVGTEQGKAPGAGRGISCIQSDAHFAESFLRSCVHREAGIERGSVADAPLVLPSPPTNHSCLSRCKRLAGLVQRTTTEGGSAGVPERRIAKHSKSAHAAERRDNGVERDSLLLALPNPPPTRSCLRR